MVIVPVHHGRIEIRKATMLNLLSGAFGIDGDRILGGPNWLELDRYDVIAKVPGDPALEKQGPLLKALLQDRYKLCRARRDEAVSHVGPERREEAADEGSRWHGRDRLQSGEPIRRRSEGRRSQALPEQPGRHDYADQSRAGNDGSVFVPQHDDGRVRRWPALDGWRAAERQFF